MANDKMVFSLEEGRGTSSVSENQSSTYTQGASATIESLRSLKRSPNATKTETIKREDSRPPCRKRKGKAGDAHISKEQSLPKKGPRRRRLSVLQPDQGPGIDFEKRGQLDSRDLQEPKRKRSREATCRVESQLKTPTKPRKLTKAKNRLSRQLTNIREENSCRGPIKGNLTHVVRSTRSSENGKDKSKVPSKELIRSNRSSNLKMVSSDHVKSKTKMKNINSRRQSDDKVVANLGTRKIRLRDKSRIGNPGTTTEKEDPSGSRVGKPKTTNLRSGSHALHSLSKTTPPRTVKQRVSDSVGELDASETQAQPGGVQMGDGILDVKIDDTMIELQSKETATALKLANDTSGFVRNTLKAVEDSKNGNLKPNEAFSKGRKENVSVDDKPTRILGKVATRYRSTLESLSSKRTMTAEKLIEELGAIRLASKRNVAKPGKVGKRHVARSARATIKKDLEDDPIERDVVKESAQDSPKDSQPDAKPIKLGRKARKNIENQMRKFGLIDKAPKTPEVTTTSTPTKKAKSPAVSGFDRLISGTGGNKEFESALAQIVSSHDDELGWTKEQEKALQSAYLSIKQTDGCFWQLISKEVPGRSAKECYNKFYSRHPTPSSAAQPPAAELLPNEIGYSVPLSDSPETKFKISSPKVTRKQKQLEAQKTIRNILGHVDGIDAAYKTNSTTTTTTTTIMESNLLDKEQGMESVLDRDEDEKAVILQSNTFKDYSSTAIPSHVEQEIDISNETNSFFETVVVSGVSTSSDKENSQPRNAQEANSKKLAVARVELILKQVEHGENLPDSGTRHQSSNNCCTSRKKKIIKSSNNNVYLHSKDALDFGDTTLDAIQRAKQELRNVFSRSGSRGGRFFDIEADVDLVQ